MSDRRNVLDRIAVLAPSGPVAVLVATSDLVTMSPVVRRTRPFIDVRSEGRAASATGLRTSGEADHAEWGEVAAVGRSVESFDGVWGAAADGR